MLRKKFNSSLLRDLAESLLRQVSEDEIPDAERADLVTSLVRQWITYDGHATLFVDDDQVYFHLSQTPLGKPSIVPEPGLAGWMAQLVREWKVDEDDLPDLIEQLNRAQSAEVTGGDGIPLRLWVNPKERSRGVESLVKQELPAGHRRDDRKVATSILRQHLGDLDPDELEALACSLVRQWQKFDGCACVFLDGGSQYIFRLDELENHHCRVDAQKVRGSLEPVLGRLGFSAEVIPEVIARINLGQEVEFKDLDGTVSRLWYDPRIRRLVTRSAHGAAPVSQVGSLPIFCPQCSAVLRPWKEGVHQQECPLCRCVISMP